MALCQAAAWRVKYRNMKGTPKITVRVENLGVHRNNRAGVYPAGIRCKELCESVISAGFLKEEISDKLVAVEEMPSHEARKCSETQTGSEYNRRCSLKDELLQTCFREPYGNVHYNLLSHNHMMIVILGFITKAKWDLDPVEQKQKNRTIKFCDEQGRLCLTAVAATDNGKELVEVIKDGISCEVLSWKMEVEEPGAATVISHALNKCSDFAMRTTEWSALYTLRGEIIKASGALGDRVAFKSVLESTHMELDSAAMDPDVDQLFDFLISIGVVKNTYFDDLADFQKIFVNSAQRQLRFAAFGVVNKLDVTLPRMKIAIIKRAYKKKSIDARNVWCSNPEATWAAVQLPIMKSAEELLIHLHEDETIRQLIDPENANKDSPKRITFYGNVDIALADALMLTVCQNKNKPTLEQARKAMLKAVSKFMREIKFDDSTPPPKPPHEWDWITADGLLDKTAVAAGTTPEASKAPGGTKAAVEVLEFDQRTGKMLKQQVSFEQAVSKAAPIELPWKSWHEANLFMAATHADKAAVVTMLENIHCRWSVSAIDVKIMFLEGKTSVVAGAIIKKNTLMLPPCVPKQCKVHDSTHEHPMAVQVSVSLADSTGQAAQDKVTRTAQFLLLPEFKVPTAVAAAQTAVAADNKGGDSALQEWVYSKDQSETLHPFWGVRRITADALQLEKDQVVKQNKNCQKGEWIRLPSFNCEFKDQVYTAVHIASVGQQNLTSTRFISVPILTNFKDLVVGEELLVRHVARAKVKKTTKISWRDVAKQEEVEQKKKPKH